MGEVFLVTSPKNIMIQDMINSENSMNTTKSTNTNIFRINKLGNWVILFSLITVCMVRNYMVLLSSVYSPS